MPDLGPVPLIEFAYLIVFLAVGLLLLIGILSLLLGIGLTRPPRVSAGIAAARGDWIDPSDADLPYSEWTFHRPRGVSLPVWDIPVPSERGRGKPIIIISHSWGGSKITSLQRVPFVYGEASRIILWDMRAHGEARGSASHLGVTEIDDLAALIGEVAGPDDAVVLYGYSMGGGISICAALRDERAIGVIADGPYRWTAEPVRRLLRLNGLPEWPIVPIIYRVLGWLLPGFIGSERARFAAQLRCPMLLLHGTHDPICPIDSAMEIAEVTPDCEFVVIPQARHLDLHIVHPERYQTTINAFIRRCVEHARARTRAQANLFDSSSAPASTSAARSEAGASPASGGEAGPDVDGMPAAEDETVVDAPAIRPAEGLGASTSALRTSEAEQPPRAASGARPAPGARRSTAPRSSRGGDGPGEANAGAGPGADPLPA